MRFLQVFDDECIFNCDGCAGGQSLQKGNVPVIKGAGVLGVMDFEAAEKISVAIEDRRVRKIVKTQLLADFLDDNRIIDGIVGNV